MKRVAIYARVSSEIQATEDKVSIDSQLTDCEAYCKERGYTVVAQFVDKEKYRVKKKLVQPSGQRKDRPGYLAMIKAAKLGEFDLIIAWKEDRLYRGMYAAIPLAELLDEKGKALEVELVRETFDRKMLGIKAALGKIEADNIRERMIMGKKARLEKGVVLGGDQVKYGYKKVETHLEIEEVEADIVQQAFAWYIAGEGIMQVRKRLNASGVLPRRGKLWAKTTVNKILNCEAYVTGKMPTTLDGETFYIPCPPIIDQATWDKSRKVRQQNKIKPKHLKNDYLCAGLVHCICGWKSYTIININTKGDTVGYYRCRHHDTSPEEVPDNCFRRVASNKLDREAWRYVSMVCDDPKVLQDAIEKKLEALRQEQGDFEADISKLQKTLDDLLMERQTIITWGRKGMISEIDMELQLDAIGLQELAYKKTLGEKLATAEARKQIEDLQSWVSDYLSEIKKGMRLLNTDPETLDEEQFQEAYEKLEAWRFEGLRLDQIKKAILEEKRRTIRAIIEKITVERLGRRNIVFGFDMTLEVPIKGILSSSLEHGDKKPETKALVLSFLSSELSYVN